MVKIYFHSDYRKVKFSAVVNCEIIWLTVTNEIVYVSASICSYIKLLLVCLSIADSGPSGLLLSCKIFTSSYPSPGKLKKPFSNMVNVLMHFFLTQLIIGFLSLFSNLYFSPWRNKTNLLLFVLLFLCECSLSKYT